MTVWQLPSGSWPRAAIHDTVASIVPSSRFAAFVNSSSLTASNSGPGSEPRIICPIFCSTVICAMSIKPHPRPLSIARR